jgi:hypothetical protein
MPSNKSPGAVAPVTHDEDSPRPIGVGNTQHHEPGAPYRHGVNQVDPAPSKTRTTGPTQHADVTVAANTDMAAAFMGNLGTFGHDGTGHAPYGSDRDAVSASRGANSRHFTDK